MSRYKVHLGIDKKDFPEVGYPFNPNPPKGLKLSRDDVQVYKEYFSEVSGRNSPSAGKMYHFDGNKVDIDFEYDSETSKTYKFLGMDIDEDFNAIVKMGSGHMIIAPMFDKGEIKKRYEMIVATNSDIASADIIDTLSEDVVRSFATSLKSGKIYDVAKKSDDLGSVDLDGLSVIISSLARDISDDSSSGTPQYKSIMLNMIRMNKGVSIKLTGVSGNDTAVAVMLSIVRYWKTVSDKYQACYSVAGGLDLWSDVNRRVLGSEEFQKRLHTNMTIFDDSDEIVDGIVSFSGVAKNGGIWDDNVLRSESVGALSNLIEAAAGTGRDEFDGKSLLLGMIDADGIDDIYSLKLEEIQAMSIVDGLQYVDDDASVCMESYDMNDEDQRALFLKSAVKSYERNFKEFKPAEYYDVTNAMVDVVDKKIGVGPKVIPMSVLATSDDDEEIAAVGVTSSAEEISSIVNVQSLKKIVKLLYKSTQGILKGFV